MKTGSIVNGEYSVYFVIANDNQTTYDVVVANEDGDYEITENNVVVPACSLSNIVDRLVEESDDNYLCYNLINL